MKAPSTRWAVIALSLALVGSMALTTQANGNSSGSNNSQQQADPMGGCCGGSQSGSSQ